MGYLSAHYGLPNGDREDDEEELETTITPEEKPTEQQQEKPTATIIKKAKVERKPRELPKAFTPSYYMGNISKSDKGSVNCQIWEALYDYSLAVFDFYKAVIKEFNYTLHQPLILPNYIANEQYQGLNIRAEELYKAEAELAKTFKRCKVSANDKFMAHGTLQELRKYAVQAWILYDNLQADNFLKHMAEIGSKFAGLDLTKECDIARGYRSHVKVKNYTNTKIKNYFKHNGKSKASTQRQESLYLYYCVDPEESLQDLMKEFNGYAYIEKEKELFPKVKTLKSKEALAVIRFYRLYPDMKFVYKKLRYINNSYKEGQDMFLIYANSDLGKERDIFETAKYYLLEVQKLKEISTTNKDYEYLLEDCIFLEQRFKEVINANKDLHQLALKAEEKQLQENPDMKRYFANVKKEDNPFAL